MNPIASRIGDSIEVHTQLGFTANTSTSSNIDVFEFRSCLSLRANNNINTFDMEYASHNQKFLVNASVQSIERTTR